MKRFLFIIILLAREQLNVRFFGAQNVHLKRQQIFVDRKKVVEMITGVNTSKLYVTISMKITVHWHIDHFIITKIYSK